MHTVWVITERSEHHPKPGLLSTRLRKKKMVGTSGVLEEDFNQVIQERTKAMSQVGFQTLPGRNNDSSDEDNDNLIFTSNNNPMFAKTNKQLEQREKDHISMM